MITKFSLAAGTVALALLAAAPVQATEVGITSLVGNDSIDWSQLGADFTNLTSPQSVVSAGSLNATVSSTGGVFQRRDQPAGWSGNFTPGMALLWDYGAGPDITLTFATPVFAVGAEIMADYYGAFTARVTDGVSTFSFTENGIATANNDGSAIFIGLLSSTGISSITFDLTSASNAPNDFAIGTVELSTSNVSATPLPSTWTMLIAGFIGLGFFASRGTKKGSAAIAVA